MPNLRKMQRYDFLKDGFGYICRIVGTAFGLAFLFVVFAGGILSIFVAVQLQRVPDLSVLKDYHPIGSMQIFDNKDKLVCSIELDNKRTIIPLKQIPPIVQEAVLAAEDRHFYEHPGVNFKSMVRAALVNLQARHVVEGGSTITQQLVKNLFFYDSERSIDRKVAEAWVALNVERKYSKPQILSLYLNEIYFGNGANGIEQAALRYFGKDVRQVNIAEAAFLAGLIRSPSVYGAADHRDEGIKRQRQILDAMVACNFVTHYQGQRAKFLQLNFRSALPDQPQHPFATYPYYVSYVLEAMKNKYGESYIKREGLKVYTNLDQAAQQAGERVISQGIKRAPPGITNGALVSLSVRDGAVRAIVGGAGDYWNKQWNCATNPHTIGSVFKPFVYLTAFLSNTLGPNSEVEDAPLTVHQIDSADYSPKNYDGRFLGMIPVRQALAQSRNVCAVKVAQMVGMNNVVETAQNAGITGDIAANISSALGSSALSPLDIAGAYGTLARCGVRIAPQVVRRVETMRGGVLDTYAPDVYRVFPEERCAWLEDVLQDVVKSGTGTQARLGDRPVAGKTGTSDKAKDLWFVGFTPDMVTAMWLGNDNNQPIPGAHITGGTVVARLWREYNRQYYARSGIPAGEFICSKYVVDDSSSERKKTDATVEKAPIQTEADSSQSGQSAAVVPQTSARSAAASRRQSQSRQTPAMLGTPTSDQSSGASRASASTTIHKGVTDYSWSR